MSRSMVAVLVVVVLASLVCCVSCAKKESGETGTPPAEQATPAAEGSQAPDQSVDTGNAYAGYLTAADVEKVTGRAGIKSIARDPRIGAGGDLNFTTSDDELALMVQIVGKTDYAQFKQSYFKSAVAGVGDEAFQGATLPNYPPNLLVFAKGEKGVALSAYADATAANPAVMVTIGQSIELAKIIASRM